MCRLFCVIAGRARLDVGIRILNQEEQIATTGLRTGLAMT